MKKWSVLLAAVCLVLATVAAPAFAGAGPGSSGQNGKTYRFRSTGTIASVDPATNTFVVRVKTMNCAAKAAKKTRRTKQTIAVSATATLQMRQINARGKLTAPVPLAVANLRAGCRVNLSGNAVVQNGAAALTAERVVMLVPRYSFQSNATIVSVDGANSTFVAKVKTMSRKWGGWKRMKNLRGQEIPIIVDATTKIFTRQLDADGVAADPVAATFADLVAGNRVHIAGKVVAAADGSIEYHALRVVEFLPAPVAP